MSSGQLPLEAAAQVPRGHRPEAVGRRGVRELEGRSAHRHGLHAYFGEERRD